jgi:hypothetical protein
MAQDTIQNDLLVAGALIARALAVQTPTITNAMIHPAADVDATKLEHQHSLVYAQSNGAAVVAEAGRQLFVCRGTTGTVVAVKASVTGAVATGADRTVTIDVQKSTGAGAFATILSSTIVLNDGSTLRAVVDGTLASTALVAGDILLVTVAVAGAAGAQAQGLVVEVVVREDAS